MSAPQKFRDLPTALAAYRAGTCRRWVEVDGWQIDLMQAAEPSKVARPGADERRPALMPQWASDDRVAHDYRASRNIAIELSQAGEVLPPLAEPAETAEPAEPAVVVLCNGTDGGAGRYTMTIDDASAYRCPWCSRPWDGAK